jgi:hypothetical protein
MRTGVNVPPPDDADADFGIVWHWVVLERDRAARAAAVAQRHEDRLAQVSEPMRAHHQRFAARYRQIEQRHLAAARLQALHAARLQKWAQDPNGHGELRPVFMAAVAAMLGVDSAAVTLFGRRHAQAMVATSDPTAQAAHELEFVLGEGPTTDATASGAVVVAAGPAVGSRWPRYGAAVAELGVLAVVATPLTLPTVCLGALCGFDSRSSLHDGVAASADKVADALTHTVLLNSHATDEADGIPRLPLFEEADYQAVVHQAAGMVSVQCDCDLDDAMAMLRARSFADGQPVAAIAEQIVRGTLRLY